MERITCVDSLGNSRTFFLEVDEDEDGESRFWLYRVHLRDPPRPEDDFYVARFREIDSATVQVSELANNGKEYYRAKGITEAIFEHIVTRSCRTLRSSSNKGPSKRFPEEFRTAAAQSVWARLGQQQKATYDATDDRWHYK